MNILNLTLGPAVFSNTTGSVEASSVGLDPDGVMPDRVHFQINEKLIYQFHGPARKVFAHGEHIAWRYFYDGAAPYTFDILND